MTDQGREQTGPRVVGEPAGERLMRSQAVERAVRETGLTAAQVAAVLHGLADHTALMAASEYSQPEDGFWPVQTSIGRWLHDTAFQLEHMDAASETATCVSCRYPTWSPPGDVCRRRGRHDWPPSDHASRQT